MCTSSSITTYILLSVCCHTVFNTFSFSFKSSERLTGIDHSAYESMLVLFGDIRTSLPLTVHCARAQHRENTHLIQTVMFHNRIRRLSVAAKLFATGYANVLMSWRESGGNYLQTLHSEAKEVWTVTACSKSPCSHVTPIIQIGLAFLLLLWGLFIVSCWIILHIHPLDM